MPRIGRIECARVHLRTGAVLSVDIRTPSDEAAVHQLLDQMAGHEPHGMWRRVPLLTADVVAVEVRPRWAWL